MSRQTNRQLEDLLRRCTKFPWTLTLNEDDTFSIIANHDAINHKVCFKLPSEISNYDKRIMSLAPELAAEVLYLRKQLSLHE